MGEAESVRTFISLDVPPTVKQSIDQLQARLRSSGGDVAWVRSPSLHLTLKFLGRVPVPIISSVTSVLEPIVARASRETAKVGGLGAFPTLNGPRVIWVGLQVSKDLIQLHDDIESSLSRLGIVRDSRPFKPHLTIGRVKSSRGLKALSLAMDQERGWEAGACELSELSLMKSELNSDGAVYTPLWTMKLGT